VAYPLLSLALLALGLALALEGLARVTWRFSLLRLRKLQTTRAERRSGPSRQKIELSAAGTVAAGLTLATIGLFLYLR
jgi:hypothetical protein